MEYITHHRYTKNGTCGRAFDIPYGTKFNTISNYIATPDGKAICLVNSHDAKHHFSRNDDGGDNNEKVRAVYKEVFGWNYREWKMGTGKWKIL